MGDHTQCVPGGDLSAKYEMGSDSYQQKCSHNLDVLYPWVRLVPETVCKLHVYKLISPCQRVIWQNFTMHILWPSDSMAWDLVSSCTCQGPKNTHGCSFRGSRKLGTSKMLISWVKNVRHLWPERLCNSDKECRGSIHSVWKHVHKTALIFQWASWRTACV